MTVTSANYTTVVTDCRNALAKGISLTGEQIRLIIDVVQHAANTLDSNTEVGTVNTDADALETLLATLSTAVGTVNTDADALETLLATLATAVDTVNTKADALEALLVDMFVAWNGAGAGDSSAIYTAQLAALATPRSDLVTEVTALVAAKTACTTPRATLVTSANAAVTANGNCTTPRATLVSSVNAAVAAGGTTVTDITASDALDGRSA